MRAKMPVHLFVYTKVLLCLLLLFLLAHVARVPTFLLCM